MGFLKSRVRSTNTQDKWLYNNYKPVAESLLQQGQGGLQSFMGQLQGTDSGQGYQNFLRSLGYNNMFNEAMRGVTGSAAARGLLSSGSTLTALQNRAGQLAQGTYQNYLQNLLGGAQASLAGGLNAGNAVANMGSQIRRTGGLDQVLGTIGKIGRVAGSLATLSDRRAKTDIELIDMEPDGLGVYEFRYLGEDEPQVGVMADEVELLRPDALGPEVSGFKTVDYGRL